MKWESTYRIHLAPDYPVDLPLMDIGDGFKIYSFDMTGEAEWNRVAARELLKKLEPYAFDGIVTVEVTNSQGWSLDEHIRHAIETSQSFFSLL